MLQWFLKTLGINTPIQSASSMGLNGKKNELALDMCKKTGAQILIFGAQGVDYANVDTYLSIGCQPYFQNYKHPVYPQLYGDFISHLSIIDLLFNCGDNSLEILMSGNETRQDLIKLIE